MNPSRVALMIVNIHYNTGGFLDDSRRVNRY
jgi:hypothetical protein